MYIDEADNVSYKDILNTYKNISPSKAKILSTPKGPAFDNRSYKELFEEYQEEQRIEKLRDKRNKNLNLIQLEKNPRKNQDFKDVL